MLGKKIRDFESLISKKIPYVAVKEAVFPFNMFPEVDPLLGPEMRATGEVMGIADTFGCAFYKAQESAGYKLPLEGTALLTVAEKDRGQLLQIGEKLISCGLKIVATEGTSKFLSDNGIENTLIKKVHEGRPNITDAIKNNEVQLIINTPIGKASMHDDSYIRMAAIQKKIPYVTSIAAALATVDGIEEMKNKDTAPKSLQEYHQDLESREPAVEKIG